MSRGARVHTTNMGDDTPLHLAAAFGNRDIVLMVIYKQFLNNTIKNFIDDSYFNQNSKNVFSFQLQFLRNKADVNFVNEHGNTALHYACFGNYPAIAEDLVEFGGLVNIENKYHETPLDKCQGNLAKRLHGK